MMDIAGRRPLLLYPMLAMIIDLAVMSGCMILKVHAAYCIAYALLDDDDDDDE